MTWTLKHIEHLEKTGKIRGFKENNPKPAVSKLPALKKLSPQKTFIQMHLEDYCKSKDIELETEYKFSERKFRFDWCITDEKIAVEYNGIMSKKSRHTTVTGYSKDMTKINLAQSLGWTVYQYTPLNYEDIVNDLKIKRSGHR